MASDVRLWISCLVPFCLGNGKKISCFAKKITLHGFVYVIEYIRIDG